MVSIITLRTSIQSCLTATEAQGTIMERVQGKKDTTKDTPMAKDCLRSITVARLVYGYSSSMQLRRRSRTSLAVQWVSVL